MAQKEAIPSCSGVPFILLLLLLFACYGRGETGKTENTHTGKKRPGTARTGISCFAAACFAGMMNEERQLAIPCGKAKVPMPCFRGPLRCPAPVEGEEGERGAGQAWLHLTPPTQADWGKNRAESLC